MGRFTGKTCRLLTMLGLTTTFFLVEIIVGYITNSLALIGDSYHMLSDVVALAVGFASVRVSKWRSKKNVFTYGWVRAEVLGALVNAVFLIALCFTIFVEAIQRMVHDEHIHDPDLMLIVGGLGLAVNIIGLFLFHGHGHGHSHGGHSHNDSGDSDDMPNMEVKADGADSKLNESDGAGADVRNSNGQIPTFVNSISLDDDGEPEIETPINRRLRSSAQLNMRAVFLHVMGDALGSVIVIISALILKFVKEDWKYKVDPTMSIIIVAIILRSTIPLLKESALILLQTVPTHIQVQDLQKKLIQKVEGVLAVHEFHVWQLAGNRIIATAHIRCRNLTDYMRIAEKVKSFFHEEGIHSTTIQPEFQEYEELAAERDCMLECGPNMMCYPDTCCGTNKTGLPNGTPVQGGGDTEGIRQRTLGSPTSSDSGEIIGGCGNGEQPCFSSQGSINLACSTQDTRF